ncbi:hypothetical protein V8B97DRAFT_2007597 [Scleroderma yunnanense]
MRAIFPPAINGGFLKLLHLAEPLEAGDTCITDACISSVKNTNAGKAVQVKGHVFCDSPTIIRVTSSFLYHSCFTNFKNTFETIDEPDYVVKLLDDTTVSVVQLKEWLAWEAESQLVKAGVTLVFHICFQVTFKDKTSYCNVCATRDVFLHDQLKHLKKPGITSSLECFGDLVGGPDDTATFSQLTVSALVVLSLPISTLNVSHQVAIALDTLA